MNRTEFIITATIILFGAYMLGWFTHWVLHRFTRVAGGDPGLWTGIFSQNRPAVRTALKLLQNRLERFATALDADDRSAVTDLLSHAKKVRDALGS